MRFNIEEPTEKDNMRDPIHNGLDAAIQVVGGNTGALKKYWRQLKGKDKAAYREPEKYDENFNNFYEDSDTERDKKVLRKGSRSSKPLKPRGFGALGSADQRADLSVQGMQRPSDGRPMLSSGRGTEPIPNRPSQRDKRAVTAPASVSDLSKGSAKSTKLQKGTKNASAKSPEPSHYTQVEEATVYSKNQAGDMKRTYIEAMASRGESSNKGSKGSAKTEKRRTDPTAKPDPSQKNYEPSHYTAKETMTVRSDSPGIGNMERTVIEGMVSHYEPSHYPQTEAETIYSKRQAGDMQRTYVEGMVSRLNLNSKRTSKR